MKNKNPSSPAVTKLEISLILVTAAVFIVLSLLEDAYNWMVKRDA